MSRPQRVSVAVEAFLRQMAADGGAPVSIKSYRVQLWQVTQALSDPPLNRVTTDRLNRYLTSAAVQSKADGAPRLASTINRTKSVIRAFFAWCERSRRIARSPAAHVRLAATCAGITRHMTRRELERFLVTIRRSRHPLAPRDHAVFATLAYTGVRLSDAVHLQVSDLDRPGGRLILRRAKGGRREEIGRASCRERVYVLV